MHNIHVGRSDLATKERLQSTVHTISPWFVSRFPAVQVDTATEAGHSVPSCSPTVVGAGLQGVRTTHHVTAKYGYRTTDLHLNVHEASEMGTEV